MRPATVGRGTRHARGAGATRRRCVLPRVRPHAARTGRVLVCPHPWRPTPHGFASPPAPPGEGRPDPHSREGGRWRSRAAAGWVLTKSSRGWAPAAWARSTAPATRAWGATWRSRCCRTRSPRSRAARALRARGQAARLAAAREHRRAPRARGGRRPPLPGDGVRRGRVAGAAAHARRAAARRDARDRGRHRRGARGGARERHRAPRPEAGQRHGDARRRREGARLRARQGRRRRRRRRTPGSRRRRRCTLRRDARWRDPRHRRLHEPRAGARQAGRPAHGHLVVRLRAVRMPDRHAGVRGRDGLGHRRLHPAERARLERAAGEHARRACATCWCAASRRTRGAGCATSATRASRSRTSSPAASRRAARTWRRAATRDAAPAWLVPAGVALVAVHGARDVVRRARPHAGPEPDADALRGRELPGARRCPSERRPRRSSRPMARMLALARRRIPRACSRIWIRRMDTLAPRVLPGTKTSR